MWCQILECQQLPHNDHRQVSNRQPLNQKQQLKQLKLVRQNRKQRKSNRKHRCCMHTCICTCKIVTHILSGFTLEEDVKRLIETTVIDKKGNSAFKNMNTSAHDGRVSLIVICWIGIICICVSFICIMCTDVTNWTKIKQKHRGHLKQLRLVNKNF
jgi:hypothetical protein